MSATLEGCTMMTFGPRAWCAAPAQGDVLLPYQAQAGIERLLRLFRKWAPDVKKQCGKRGECEPRLDRGFAAG